MLDVVVVGAGVAGLNAALVLGRARRHTLVLDGGPPRNAPSPAAHGFVTRDGTPPLELLQIGRDQLRPYTSVEVHAARAVDAARIEGGFSVVLDDGSVRSARRILLATGVVDELPPIDGLKALWGTGVLHCPFCHGWEVRDEPLAVYGRGEPGIEHTRLIRGWSPDLILCSDGPAELDGGQRAFLDRHGIGLRDERIVRVEGSPGRVRIVFEGNDVLERAALFVPPGQSAGSDLPTRLGCELSDDGKIRVGDDGSTSVPGVYAAGDATSPFQQVVFAAAAGARAAIAIQRDLVAEEFAFGT